MKWKEDEKGRIENRNAFVFIHKLHPEIKVYKNDAVFTFRDFLERLFSKAIKDGPSRNEKHYTLGAYHQSVSSGGIGESRCGYKLSFLDLCVIHFGLLKAGLKGLEGEMSKEQVAKGISEAGIKCIPCPFAFAGDAPSEIKKKKPVNYHSGPGGCAF